MGTTAYGGRGSKGRAANGDRPVGAAGCRRDHHTHGVMPNPPPPLSEPPRHRWRNGNGGPKQRLGGPSLKEREGKGSEWRSASGRRQLQTRTQDHGFLPKPPV